MQRSKIQWLMAWLTCVAFYYPAVWFSNSIVWAGPALVRWALFRYRLDMLRPTAFGAMAFSSPHNQPAGSFSQVFAASNTILLSLLVLLAFGLLVVFGRANRLLSGLAIAALGNAAFVPALVRGAFSHQIRASGLADFAFGYVILCLGLSRMLSGWFSPTYWNRVLNLVAGYVPLPVIACLLIGLGRRNHFWLVAIALTGPSVLAALLIGLHAISARAKTVFASGTHAEGTARDDNPLKDTRSGTWKIIGLGALSSLLIFFGARGAQSAIEHARMAKARAVLETLSDPAAHSPYPRLFFQKGVNFTAEFPATYDSEAAREFLAELPRFAINAIALMPYGWTRPDEPAVQWNGNGSWENDVGLEILACVAHEHGMKVMLKPAVWHAYDLDFPSARDRAKWFESYRGFILHYARLAAQMHADLFCIGGEFVHLSRYDAEWRKLVVQIRGVYPGPLVYAANFGAEFQGITFWDALDCIGIQEYYPLPGDFSANAISTTIEAVSKKYDRPVIFTEVGFPSLEGANLRPWDDAGHRRLAMQLQAQCYQAIFRAFYQEPWFEGMYWWKIETNGGGGPEDGSHSPWGKPAMQVLANWYSSNRR